MRKLKVLLSVVAMSFVMIGCGSSGGGSSGSSNDSGDISAEGILVGKTFYYTDDYLDFSDGYYKDYFDANSLTESEHMADGTLLYSDTIQMNYSGTNIIFSYQANDGAMETCGVIRAYKSVEISCPSNGYVQILWDTIEDAKANLQQ